MINKAISLAEISSGTLEIWVCGNCGQQLGTITSHWVLSTKRGDIFGGDGNQIRSCPRCSTVNVTTPLDKR